MTLVHTDGAPPGSARTVATALVRGDLLRQVPSIVHGITARVPGMGGAHGNVAYSPPRDKADAWAMRTAWCAALGLDPEAIVTAGQVHGAATIAVGREQMGLGARPNSGRCGLGDALLTRQPGPVLMTLHADCLPIILVDPTMPAVASVHAGWRGTVADVAGSAVHALTETFGTRPGNLLAFLGPSICVACYEVGDDVANAWHIRHGREDDAALVAAGERYRFDLKGANARLLQAAGVPLDQTETSPICTRCGGDDWFSHRGQGPETGRFGAFVAIA